MYDKFYNIAEEKQHKIINAALKVFSKTTFKKASTDEIVTEAGISKGALFHYFKSKKNLFLFLYDYTKDVLLKELYEKIDFNEKDIFKRFESILMIKLTLIQKHPDMFDFMIKAVYDDSKLHGELQNKNNDTIAENMAIILKDIDRNKFRQDIDITVAIDMILLTFEGYANRELLRMRQSGFNQELHDKWLREFKKYIETMKNLYYKENEK